MLHSFDALEHRRLGSHTLLHASKHTRCTFASAQGSSPALDLFQVTPFPFSTVFITFRTSPPHFFSGCPSIQSEPGKLAWLYRNFITSILGMLPATSRHVRLLSQQPAALVLVKTKDFDIYRIIQNGVAQSTTNLQIQITHTTPPDW